LQAIEKERERNIRKSIQLKSMIEAQRNKAAIVIACSWRAFSKRREFNKMRIASTKIKNCWRR
jgi:hypothetical protein